MATHKPNLILQELEHSSSPDILFRTIKDLPYSFFLDSGCDYDRTGRFSFLGADPFLVFKTKRDSVTLEWGRGDKESFKASPFLAAKEIFNRYAVPPNDFDIPFLSGAVGYFSYDLKDFIEELPDTARDDLGIPDCILGFYDVVIIRDNLYKKTYIASSGLPETSDASAHRKATARLNEFKKRLLQAPSREYSAILPNHPILRSNFTRKSYMEAVEKAKHYIANGDIYQVNLSQRFRAHLEMEPYQLYLRLKNYSPAPFAAYLGFKEVAILSSSPERFIMKKGDYVETRPIKGTRPRGEDVLSDLFLARELRESRKDAAEHIMIVDLERNDLGRICEYGSVIPTESAALERYANVFHLVSTVAGRLRKNMDPIGCLLATFPGGSITGAPKIRSMEIIEELEPVKRSIYTGAIGYISFDGNMDTSIVIRTFIVKDRDIYFQVGGGIVADSEPVAEYEETIHKARGLMKALGVELPEKEFLTV